MHCLPIACRAFAELFEAGFGHRLALPLPLSHQGGAGVALGLDEEEAAFGASGAVLRIELDAEDGLGFDQLRSVASRDHAIG